MSTATKTQIDDLILAADAAMRTCLNGDYIDMARKVSVALTRYAEHRDLVATRLVEGYMVSAYLTDLRDAEQAGHVAAEVASMLDLLNANTVTPDQEAEYAARVSQRAITVLVDTARHISPKVPAEQASAWARYVIAPR